MSVNETIVAQNNRFNTYIKCITLIFREIKLNKENEKMQDYSVDLIKGILPLFNTINDNVPTLGAKALMCDSLQDLCNNIINNIDGYNEDLIIDSLNMIIKDDPSTLNGIIKNLTKEISKESLKQSILSLRIQLNSYSKEVAIKKKINKASFDLNVDKTINIIEYAKNLLLELDALTSSKGDNIPGIVNEIDIEDSSMVNAINAAKDMLDGSSKLQTGFREMNTMLQNGFKRGDSVVINALQHEYKSGLVQTLAMQIPMFNKPHMIDINKKPLILYISFEDDAEVFISFMYKYLYSSEHGVNPDMTAITSEEIQNYIKEKIKINGYHIKMLRVNPSEWTYKELFNYILYLESLGYEIHACIVDYLIKMSVAGCVGKGGTEYRDLFDRCRQFFSVRKITFITPHQMSTEAKQLIRNGENKLKFVKEVAGKGYTELSKQIDQVVDIEICIAKAIWNKKWVLTMYIGKHRGAGIIDDGDKFQALLFPPKMPIPSNLDKEDYKPINLNRSKDEEDLFSM